MIENDESLELVNYKRKHPNQDASDNTGKRRSVKFYILYSQIHSRGAIRISGELFSPDPTG